MKQTTKKGKESVTETGNVKRNKNSLSVRIWQNRYMYILFLPLFIYLLIFAYYPMYGITLAFKDFNYAKGIIFSPLTDHNGLGHFISLFRDPQFEKAFSNTIVISISRLAFCFPIPIILALLINEVKSVKYKKVVQTIFTFPHFISWIIVFGLFFNLFSSDGLVNQILAQFGIPKTSLLSTPSAFRPLLYISSNWKEMGWSSIIYLATITGISPELYEAAKIDGASRRQLVWYITLPSLASTIAVLFILNVAGLMDAGFDQIFNMSNAAVLDKADIIDTMIYRKQFKTGGGNFGFSTAAGLFKSIINFALLLAANAFCRKKYGKGIY